MGGVLLLVVGLVLLVASFMFRGEPLPDGFAWKAPLEQVSNGALEPATVLLPLTTISAGDALNATLDSGHWENAFAIIAYDPSLSDAVRIGTLLQLGARYAATRQPGKAAWCYVAAARVAIISPMLSDAVRQDTILQVSSGLREIGAKDASRWAVDQAYLMVEYSPALQRDQSSRRNEQVANAYAALGANELAQQVRAKGVKPVAVMDNTGYLPREPFVIRIGALPQSVELSNALQVRIAAAKQLQQDLSSVQPNRPIDWAEDSLNQLKSALLQEDRVRLAYYDQQLARTIEPSVKIALAQDEVNWIALKYRIARGAFGADLVPEWSKDPVEILTALNRTFADLSSLYESEAVAIPNADAVNQAMEDVTRQKLLAVRWGWYAEPAQELYAKLSELTQKLRAASVPSLRLDLLTINGKSTDFLVPDELYGKGSQALPR